MKRRRLSELGQTTTEYILMLAVAVSLAVIASKILRPAVVRLSEGVSNRMRNVLTKSLHHLPIGR